MSITEQFEEFHRDNPHVYTILVRLARQWRAQTGRTVLGTKALFERARWELAIETSDADYKLNNNYTAYYARLIMLLEDDLDTMFRLRDSEADEWIYQKARELGVSWAI
jgi:hypothetical protein